MTTFWHGHTGRNKVVLCGLQIQEMHFIKPYKFSDNPMFIFLFNTIRQGFHCKMDPAEEQEILTNYGNGGTFKYEASQFNSVHQLFEETALKYPLLTALEETNGSTTNYETLAKDVNKLSKWISSKSKSPYKFVALLLSNGKKYVCASAASMKLGKTFVPLDPKFPLERLKVILEDLENPLLITSRDNIGVIADLRYDSTKVLYMEAMEDVFEANNKKFVNKSLDNAYCIYTSGSTGVPKGVTIQHAAILNWIGNNIQELGLKVGERSLAFSNPTFDMSLAQIWPILCSGGTVVFPPLVCDMAQLHDFVAERSISILVLPTIPAQTFFDQTRFTSLRWIMFGGETLRCGNCTRLPLDLPFGISNCYGPTETTICITYQKFFPGDIVSNSVGRPIPNHMIYIMDENQVLVKPGIVGEIYIGGIGVSAEGYHNRDEQNQRVFITTAQGRLCRTGDLGVWREDGALEIRGRMDTQLKVRGYRVEIGDVESNLQSHPSVTQALVVHNPELDTLNAFVTLKPKNMSVKPDALKTYLTNRLPRYALPALVVILDEFPLNSSGKIDKNKLLEMVSLEKTSSTPRTNIDLESNLIQIWANLLQIPAETLSLSSNFFELGGHSRLGVKLVCEIREMVNRPDILNFVTVFYHPTIGDLLEALKTALEQNRDLVPSIGSNIELESDNASLPLSFAQEQIWMHQAQDPTSTLWNVVRVIRFNQPIKVKQLEKSLKVILLRNPCFRTTFHSMADKIWQIITDVPILNLSSFEVQNLNDAIAKLRNAQFDHKTGPLYRFCVTDEKNLVISYHHIILDGHGWVHFLKELDIFYSNGSPTTSLSPNSFQDAVLRERKSNLPLASIHYWNLQLQDFKPVNLTANSGKLKGPGGNIISKHQFSAELSHNLCQLARQKKTTLFGLMFSIFKILLYRHTQETDQTLITLFRSGLSQTGTEVVIGNFVNLIPIRTVIDGRATFSKFLEQSKLSLAEGLKHGCVPYQKILQGCKQPRLLKERLLKTMFQMRPLIEGGLNTFQEVWLDEIGISQVDLGVDICNNDSNGIICAMDFNSTVYTKSFIQRIMGQYEQLCSSILNASGKNTSIDELNILSVDERRTILQEFSFTKTVSLPQLSLLQQFQQHADYGGSALCVKDSNSVEMNYGEFNQEITDIADIISARFDISTQYVAILLPRSIHLIASSLAIVKTGRIVVPLNPEFPPMLLVSILKNLNNPILITDRSRAQILSTYQQEHFQKEDLGNIVLMRMQNDDQVIKSESTPVKQNQDVMYCIFTSGTTGLPKGVLIKHDSVLNVVQTYVNLMDLTTEDRAMMFHNPGFDASLMDFWPSLVTGGSICIPDGSLSYDPERLYNFIQENQITYANLPTAVAEKLFVSIHWQNSGSGSDLRWLTFGGEQLKITPPDGFPAMCLNAYGPTEGTIDTAHCIVNHSSKNLNTIGRPIPNAKVYILDDFKNPVPIGVEGMLWIGGKGVANGYLNNQDLSSQVFVPNPFDPEESMYCSGDVAKWLDDGTIAMGGRKDDQVKINGFRIELPGIEVALVARPGILQAAVKRFVSSRTSAPYLVAFCVPESQQYRSICLEDIEDHLKARLPQYSLPRFLHWIDSMPLTSNGKLDSKALLLLHDHESRKDNTIKIQAQPLKGKDLELAHIWAVLLHMNVTELQPCTNFFEAGGSSILIGQLIREINKTQSTSISFRDVFDKPTLGAQATLLETLHEAQVVEERNVEVLSSYRKYIWFRQNFELGKGNTSLNLHRVIEVNGYNEAGSIKQKLLEVLEKFNTNLGFRMFVSQGEIRSKFQPIHEITQSTINHPEALKSLVANELARPYDLIAGINPLFSIRLVSKENAQQHYICCFWHEILLTSDIESAFFMELELKLNIPHDLRQIPIKSSSYNIIEHSFFKSTSSLDINQNEAFIDLNDSPGQLVSESCNLTGLKFQKIFDKCQAQEDIFKAVTLENFQKLGMQRTIFNKIDQSSAVTENKYESDSNRVSRIWLNIIAKMWSLVVGIPISEIHANSSTHFFELQGTSADLLKTSTWLLSLLGVAAYTIPHSHFFQYPTLNSISHSLRDHQPVTGPDSIIDCILEDEVSMIIAELSKKQSAPYVHPTGKINIFLTGSTGYVGAFLLEALLNNSKIKQIYCLIRGESQSLVKVLEKYGILSEADALPTKILPVHGDLDKPEFGLNSTDYQILCEKIDVICHCGAQVNLVHSYDQLKGPNVLGTKSVCKLALTGKPKALHYISTTDAAVGLFTFEKTTQIAEGKIGPPPYWETGYYQTKWVSECLIEHMNQSIPARIHRVGTIGAPSNRSLVNPTSFDGLFIRAAVEIGAYPELPGFTVPYSEVDHVGNILSNIISTNPLENPELLRNIVQKNYSQTEVFNEKGLFGIEPEEWYQRFISQCESKPHDDRLQSLRLILEQRPWRGVGKWNNFFEVLKNMPLISYPTLYQSERNPNINKYIQLHCE